MNPTAVDQNGAKQNSGFKAADRREPMRYEILDGKLTPKEGANRAHNLISTNFAIAIGSRLQRGTSELYVNNMQVQIGPNSICYPDVVVVNGEATFTDAAQEVLQNPSVLIEIFSGESKTTDRTRKLEGFLAVPHIKECLLVNQNEMRVEHYARQNAKQWIYRIYNERDDVISIEAINCKLSLAEVYAQVMTKNSELSSKAVN